MEIETDRLYLRKLDVSDKESFFKYRSNPEIYYYQLFNPVIMDDAVIFINSCSETFNEPDTWYQFALLKKTDLVLVGDLGVHFRGSEVSELGFTIAKEFQRKGYATEALKAVIKILFQRFNKKQIMAVILENNEPAKKLLESLNFCKKSTKKRNNESENNEAVYFLQHSDWIKQEKG